MPEQTTTANPAEYVAVIAAAVAAEQGDTCF